ncbi:MAG: tol-pal system YbgF family protein [Syntrophobacteraceae bacterium]
MKKSFRLLLLFVFCLVFQGCASVDNKAALDARAKADAALEDKTKRDNDIFRSYGELNTIEGYREFIQKYPDNLNLRKAQTNIEMLEYAECDDPACLADFIAKFPGSPKAFEAKERLKQFDVTNLDRELKSQYGFDLLLYRLSLKRLRKELIESGKGQLSGFMAGFSMVEREGKTFFLTRLSFGNDSSITDISSPETIDQLFDSILSFQLDYLSVKFKKKQRVGGFAFEIVGPVGLSSNNSVLHFYFSTVQVDRFIQGGLPKEELIKSSLSFAPSAVSPAYEAAGPPGQAQGEAQTSQEVLRWTSANDGLAKGGKFVRTSDPAFTFECPGNWRADKPKENEVFSATSIRSAQSCRLSIVRVGEAAASKADLSGAEEAARLVKEAIEKNVPSRDVMIAHVRPTKAYGEYPAFESEIKWKLNLPMAGVGPVSMATYVNYILTRCHAILLSVSLPTDYTMEGVRLGSSEVVIDPDSVFKSLVFSPNTAPPKPCEAAAVFPQPLPAKVVIDNPAPAPAREETKSEPKLLQLMPVASARDGSANAGRFVRSAPPAFALNYPADWRAQSKHDSIVFNSIDDAPTHPAMRIMTAKITGNTTAYLESFGGAYWEFLAAEPGINVEVLYSVPTEAYSGHEAYEFEMRCKLRRGKQSSAWTVYGNAVSKDGYAIILIGETAGDIDPLKTMFEKIDFARQ